MSVSEQGVTVQDVTDWPGQVELTLMTQARPVPAKDGLHLEKLGRICFDPDTVEAAVQPVPVTDPRLRTAWPEDLSDHAAFPLCGGTAAGITKEK